MGGGIGSFVPPCTSGKLLRTSRFGSVGCRKNAGEKGGVGKPLAKGGGRVGGKGGRRCRFGGKGGGRFGGKGGGRLGKKGGGMLGGIGGAIPGRRAEYGSGRELMGGGTGGGCIAV